MKRNYTILCIEDDDADFLLIQRQLKNSKLGATLDRVETEAELRAFVASHDVDLILSDNNLPGFSGIQALEIMQQIEPDIPFIIVSGTIGEELAVSAMRSGASDYILKDNLKRLLPAVEREISDFQLRKKERLNRKQLILTELRYKFLAESIKEVFFALDHKLRFTYWNDTASKIFRKTDIIGKNVNDVFPEWQDSQILAVLSESLVNGIEKPLRFTHRVRGTEYFKGKVYPSTEGVSVLLSNVTDETHGRKKLEIVNNELATLFYRISHDLKGPVASVLGLLNIATKDELMSKEQLTGMIKANVDRLNAILSELLDITNIKTGETKLSTLEIASCIESIIESLKHQAGFEEMKFRINISKDLLFRSDKILFKSIWQNLIENSIKFRKKGQINDVSINGEKKSGKILFQISDSGQGISKDVSSRIYHMFFRGNENSNGSGLGLYIVKNAVEKLKGTIKLDESYKKGARFILSIPTAAKVRIPKVL